MYSFINLSFSFLCSILWLSSTPKYLYAFIVSNSLIFDYYYFIFIIIIIAIIIVVVAVFGV
jgi:hypothetical protein